MNRVELFNWILVKMVIINDLEIPGWILFGCGSDYHSVQIGFNSKNSKF